MNNVNSPLEPKNDCQRNHWQTQGSTKNLKMYNTMFDVAFSVVHNCENPENVKIEHLVAEMRKKVEFFEKDPSEATEAFGICDTYEIRNEETH